MHASIANISALKDGKKLPSGSAMCFKNGLCSSHNPHHKYGQLFRPSVQLKFDIMTVAGVPDRALGQNTFVKTSVILPVSDLRKLHTQKILSASRSFASVSESCLTFVLDLSVERNPLESGNFFFNFFLLKIAALYGSV